MHHFSSVALVDRRGWILLQERDEHPVIDPDRWGFPGGHVEEGEHPDAAAYRELAEETGVALTGGLVAWRDFEVFHEAYGSDDVMHLYVAGTDLLDDDIACHEGRQMVFVAPDRVRQLALTVAAGIALPQLLASDLYRELAS